MVDDGRRLATGRLALATGLVAVGSAVCLGTYFAVQGPFGTMNDVGNAATGVLSGWLAWRMRRQITSGVGTIALGAAVAGAAMTVVGSSLVVSGATGFLFAGLVSSLGFAGIGAWLMVLNRSSGRVAAWPGTLRAVGVAAGTLMALGIFSAPAIPLGLDDMEAAPAWVWIGFVGWLGVYVVYPAWAIAMGRFETDRAGVGRSVPATAMTD
jgi:hypothetical protein